MGRGVLTGKAAEDISRQDRTPHQKPRVLVYLIEEICRGFHALDHCLRGILDMLEHVVDRAFGPIPHLLQLLETL